MTRSRARSTQVTPLGDETGRETPSIVDENDGESGVLVVGETVPCLSIETDIPYLVSKLRNVKAQWSLDMVPLELQNARSDGWKKNGTLQDTFKVVPEGGTSATTVPKQYPHCLVLSGKTVSDRLVIMSW